MPRHAYKYARQTGAGPVETLKRVTEALGLTESRYPGETHVRGYNYLGPGTRLDLREAAGPPANVPINRLDSAAKRHDEAYARAGASGAKGRDLMPVVHEADDAFVREVKAIPGITAELAARAIQVKKLLEKVGLLDMAAFSQHGLGLPGAYDFKPAHYLLKERRLSVGGQKGGFLPALAMLGARAMPFVGQALKQLVWSAAPTVLDKLVGLFTKKDVAAGQQGSGLELKRPPAGSPRAKVEEFVLNILDNLSPEHQIARLEGLFR